MPLGGSVTRGVGSSDGTGYRKSPLQMLRLHGLNAHMVGSRKDGSMPNNDHEGWRGFRIDEIERKARKSVKRLSPQIFMVNAGSNDCLQSFKIPEVGKRMGYMLDYLWLASPQSTILLSTLLVNADKEVDSAVMRVNDQFRALAKKKKKKRRLSKRRLSWWICIHGKDLKSRALLMAYTLMTRVTTKWQDCGSAAYRKLCIKNLLMIRNTSCCQSRNYSIPLKSLGIFLSSSRPAVYFLRQL